MVREKELVWGERNEREEELMRTSNNGHATLLGKWHDQAGGVEEELETNSESLALGSETA